MLAEDLTESKLIDNTLLADETELGIIGLCEDACKYAFNSVCVRPEWVKFIKNRYNALNVAVVVGFPLKKFQIGEETLRVGSRMSVEEKEAEAMQAIDNGAIELDPVIDIEELITNAKTDSIELELKTYYALLSKIKDLPTFQNKALCLKPIFSAGVLLQKADNTNDLLDKAIEALVKSFAEFKEERVDLKEHFSKLRISFKNSTGFVPGLRNATDLEMIAHVAAQLEQMETKYGLKKGSFGIKAAGGIKTLDLIRKLVEVSAGRLTHIGSSNGVEALGL